jgi:hypothetical protein
MEVKNVSEKVSWAKSQGRYLGWSGRVKRDQIKEVVVVNEDDEEYEHEEVKEEASGRRQKSLFRTQLRRTKIN